MRPFTVRVLTEPLFARDINPFGFKFHSLTIAYKYQGKAALLTQEIHLTFRAFPFLMPSPWKSKTDGDWAEPDQSIHAINDLHALANKPLSARVPKPDDHGHKNLRDPCMSSFTTSGTVSDVFSGKVNTTQGVSRSR